MNRIIQEDIDYIISNNINWYKFKNKTILITGANGLLPSYMVYTLINLNEKKAINCKIIAMVRSEKKGKEKFCNYMIRSDFKLIVNDVCVPISLDEKVDYIIHAASQASPIYYNTDPVGTINANVIGTHNMLNIAAKNKVEGFLFFSSGEVYGEIDEKHIPTKECDYGYLDPTNIRSCYGESKRLGETMCVSWYKQYKVPCKMVRPFHTYGPGIKIDDGRVFADFIYDIVNKRNIVLKSEGEDIRTFCYIADAVSGFFTILLKGKNGESYNVSNDKCSVSIKNLAELLVSLYSERNLKVEHKLRENSSGYLVSLVDKSYPDITKIKALGWKPIYSLEEGFRRTIRSVENNE
ncbi:NAD-dependent epimerase/dehydratase family protein [Clostridium akagii]|uniref:NAD-dependent epimerase/dehydratase family protein n=1 Tax=Clostridium akagii TaxID=91623 RepID=UPI0004788E49|nr:NAD-dependent epimerase/dehydratase family protein [Clostridium akagii]